VAEFDTLAMADAVEAILKADPRCADWHVTQEFDPALSWPWVVIDTPSEERTATFLTGGHGAPDVVQPRLTITINTADVQSARSARRQAHDAARIAVDVLRGDYTLGGTVLTHQVHRIEFTAGADAEHATMYAAARLHLTAEAIA
jgi:hypothetical protein